MDPNRLKAMLSGAKAVMNKVESGDYSSGNIDSEHLAIDGTQLVEGTPDTAGVSANPTRKPSVISEQQINNSKLPDSVKQAMLENPIQQPSMANMTFSLDDVSDLVDKPMPLPTPKGRAPIQESVRQPQPQSTGLNISENVLRAMIKDVLIEYLRDDVVKGITENAIKQTIKTLIKEGKLATKKKVTR